MALSLQSTKWKIPFVQLQKGKIGNTGSDVHQGLVWPAFTLRKLLLGLEAGK